ncbi:MAG: DUF4982 domain-containing protein [Clostridia bacterium]|nr:DUF4982 domain-containing protein [Clostridia bacterium]
MRKVWNLNRDWHFRQNIEENRKTLSHAEAYMFTQAGSAGGMAAVHYDDSDWSVVQLPHDYAAEAEFSAGNLLSHGYKGQSNAWYRKRFFIPEEYRNKHILLTFGGIAMKARIYCNGSLLARSFTAYTPIAVDLTGRAYFGDRANTLAVEVDGYSLEGWFYEGAGIYRDVKLYAKELLHLAHEGIFWKPVPCGDGWTLHWEALVENSDLCSPRSAPFVLRAELYDKKMQIAAGTSEVQVCPAGESLLISGDLPISAPHLWDVDDPYLYTARLTLMAEDGAEDSETAEIGFRTFTADSKCGFLLNGRPIKLKGTCNHQDHAGVGTAIPESVWEYRLSLLKELGSNTYRCSHNMPDETLLSLCDRMGMLVIDEPRHFESGEEAIRQAEALARQARNHPSVVLYSLFNEEALQSTAEGCYIYRKLRHAISRWDDSRLFTGALGGGALDPDGTALLMDVTGINYALPIAEKFHEMYPDQPVFGSENNSALSTRGCFETDAEKHTCAGYDEDFVPWGNRTRDNWRFTAEHDWYGGICVWTGFDYRGEPTPYQWPSISSQFGIFDTCGFPKSLYWQNKVCFTDEPLTMLLPHWNWTDGQTVRVMAVTNCEEAELRLNGVSLGRKPAGPCDPAFWEVPFTPGTLEGIGYRNGQPAGEICRVCTAGTPKKIVLEPHKTTIAADGRDAVCINCHLTDENGIPHPTADDLIRFTVEGGVLLGVGNGDPNSHESDRQSCRRLFTGRAQLIVGSVPDMEHLRITASCEGLEDAVLEIEVQRGEMPAYLPSTEQRMLHGAMVSIQPFDKRPDILQEIPDYDMNTMEHIVFDSTSLKPRFTDGWHLYRIPIQIPRNIQEGEICSLRILRVAAKHIAAVLDGETLLDNPEEIHGDGKLEFLFSGKPGQWRELRLLLEGTGEPSGIGGGFELCTCPAPMQKE